MAERSTIARPYAKAAFEAARAGKRLAPWSGALAALAAGVSDPAIQTLLGSPRIPRARLTEVFAELVGKELGEPGLNFLRLLAENRRLGLLPEIAQLFAELRAEAERAIEATVTSAVALDDRARAELTRALRKRLAREVTLKCETDPGLIGGAVIRAGDLVIDGSVRGKLERLAVAITR
jgi:F-type H+-transporting ATPase subunit delta